MQKGDENLLFQTRVVEPFTWIWLGTKIAEGVITGVAGYTAVEFIKANFNRSDDYSELFRAAITEICLTIKEEIDNAFLQEYTSDSESVRQQLKDYGDHQHSEILDETLSKTYDLVNRFKSYGPKGFGGLTLACNLHLLTLKALSEVPGKESFKITLEKTCKEYADMLEKSAGNYIGIFRENIKKNLYCVHWDEVRGGPAPPGSPTAIYLINKIGGEGKKFQVNEGQKCVEEVNNIIEKSVSEHEPYTKCIAMIKGYRELKVNN